MKNTERSGGCFSPSRWNIYHETEIQAPIQDVWDQLIDIGNWEWNKWTKLEAEEASAGTCGTLQASYNGDDNWESFDFTFGEVNSETYVLNWFGKIGFGTIFSGDHTMRLEEGPDANTTTLIHSENFGGLLPALGLGLPYSLLDRNYLLMNEALKEYVEGNSTSTKTT